MTSTHMADAIEPFVIEEKQITRKFFAIIYDSKKKQVK